MTTQVTLLALGQEYRHKRPEIHTVMTSIDEARAAAESSLCVLEQQVAAARATLDNFKIFEQSGVLMLNNTPMVASAADTATNLSMIAKEFMNLACLLSAAGADIRY